MLKTLCVWFVLERGRKLLNLQLTLILMWLTTTVAKTIGPVGTITIANKEIAPDGFKRPYVFFPALLLSLYSLMHS